MGVKNYVLGCNGREPKSYLGQVFNSKLGCINAHTATSRVENVPLVFRDR